MYIHPAAASAIERLETHGYEAYAVGGCVRDSLMGLAPHDWDVCTSALPQQVAACFAGAHVIEIGMKHGTVTVVLQGLPIEITTYRTDGDYVDHRHPTQVTFVRTLHEDLARRDFTMNAMAYHPKSGLIDPFDGQADISARLLRSVGDPDKRFEEDGLRIMRALRFSSRFGFPPVAALDKSIHRQKALLTHISVERLYSELCGLLLGLGAKDILLAYPDVLAVFLPETAPMVHTPQHNPYHQYSVWRHTAEAVQAAPAQKTLRLTMLFHDVGKPSCHITDRNGMDRFPGHPAKGAEIARNALKRLKADNQTLEAVCELVMVHDEKIAPADVVHWLHRLGAERFEQLLQVKRADILAQAEHRRVGALAALQALRDKRDEVLAFGPVFQLKDLAVSGKDVLSSGIPEGKAVGEALHGLLTLVMDGTVENQRDALLSALHSEKNNR